MQIIIVGDGKVGVALTEQLSSEGHDITVIDSNPKVLEQSLESYDVMVVHGNGASIGVLKEAGVEDAHLLIAATSRDETNLLTCIVAKKLGAKHTIARVRNPEYAEQLVLMRDELGLSMTINPELAAAREIHHLRQFPSFLKRDSFAKGRVEIVEIHVGEDSKLAGIPLNRLYEIARVRVLVCVVERGGTVHIPDGSFTLQAGGQYLCHCRFSGPCPAHQASWHCQAEGAQRHHRGWQPHRLLSGHALPARGAGRQDHRAEP